MKNQIFLMLLLASLILPKDLLGQCELTNLAVELKSTSSNSGICTATIDLAFNLDKNGGNKFTYVHLWNKANYPASINLAHSEKAPDKSDLGAVLATLAIDTDGAVSLLSEYSADKNNVIPVFTGVTLSEELVSGTLYRITVQNITFPITCGALPVIKGNFWSTQAASANPTIHCGGATPFELVVFDPTLTGSINCNEPSGPRTYNLDIATVSTTPITVTYKLYLDDGVLSSGTRTFGAGDALLSTQTVTISSNVNEQVHLTNQSYAYGAGQSLRSVWVEMTSSSLPNALIAELVPACITSLPVKLAQFEGKVIEKKVSVSWKTAEESGSDYFELQRAGKDLEFATIKKVKAAGDANSVRYYGYLDETPLNGVNYYRLLQMDLNGQFEYSRMISVNTEVTGNDFELLGNPVEGNNIRVLMNNSEANSLTLFNLSGRKIATQLKNEGGGIFEVKSAESLTSGVYILSLEEKNKRVTRKVLIK